MNAQRISYKFSYSSVYEEIYDSSYGPGFVFIDEDDETYGDVGFDSSILPTTPAGLFRDKEVGIS